jgi:hypothetical protein
MAFSLSHISETYSHAITKSMELHTTIKGHYRFISKGKAICDYLFIVIHNMHGIGRKQLVEFCNCTHIFFFFPVHVKPSIFNSLFLFLVNFHYYCSLNTRFGSSNFVARKDHCLSNTYGPPDSSYISYQAMSSYIIL